jgi:hypothetical protein
MHLRHHSVASSAAAGLAIALLAIALLATGCSGGASSHPSAATATKSAPAAASSTVVVTDREDSNWAGYVVTSGATANTSFSSVAGSWTQPAADCGGGYPSDSAFWVGLGGYTGDHLEQTGTSADCSKSGQPVYYVWYELVPAAQVEVNMTVQPGDQFSAHVSVSGDSVTISISNLTAHTTFSKQLRTSSPTVSSAEWIAEAPSRCLSSSSQDCHILSLADFGNVTFTGASVSANGRTGSITSDLGPVSALTLEANPGFGRLYDTAAEGDASPGALSPSGSSFTVGWQRPQIQQPNPPDIVMSTGPIYN